MRHCCNVVPTVTISPFLNASTFVHEHRIKELEENLEEQTHHNLEAADDIQELEDKLKDAERKLKKATGSSDDVGEKGGDKAKVEALQKDLNKAHDEAHKLQKQLDKALSGADMGDELKKLQAELRAAQSDDVEMAAKLKAAEAAAEASAARAEAADKHAHEVEVAAEGRVKDEQDTSTEHLDNRAELEGEVSKSGEEVKALTSQLEDVKRQLQTALDGHELGGEIKLLNEKVKTIEAEKVTSYSKSFC